MQQHETVYDFASSNSWVILSPIEQRIKNKIEAVGTPLKDWEDFSKPKIIWKRIGSVLRFSYDCKGYLGLDSTCFATGAHIAYLCCFLNSLMGHYLLKDSPKTGTGDLLVSVQAIEPVLVPFNPQIEDVFEKLLQELILKHSDVTEKKLNHLIFKLFNLSLDEIQYITEYVTQGRF